MCSTLPRPDTDASAHLEIAFFQTGFGTISTFSALIAATVGNGIPNQDGGETE
jgi:hypothetical protein